MGKPLGPSPEELRMRNKPGCGRGRVCNGDLPRHKNQDGPGQGSSGQGQGESTSSWTPLTNCSIHTRLLPGK